MESTGTEATENPLQTSRGVSITVSSNLHMSQKEQCLQKLQACLSDAVEERDAAYWAGEPNPIEDFGLDVCSTGSPFRRKMFCFAMKIGAIWKWSPPSKPFDLFVDQWGRWIPTDSVKHVCCCCDRKFFAGLRNPSWGVKNRPSGACRVRFTSLA